MTSKRNDHMSASTFLIRYGTVPEVARFRADGSELPERGSQVVVRSHRGVELGTVLQSIPSPSEIDASEASDVGTVLHQATDADRLRAGQLQAECRAEFEAWRRRITEWNVDVELIDLEWTLDREKLILYVLNERGPDCTKLALHAAAAGLGVIEVQPVNAEGLKPLEMAGGGCGCSTDGGCGR